MEKKEKMWVLIILDKIRGHMPWVLDAIIFLCPTNWHNPRIITRLVFIPQVSHSHPLFQPLKKKILFFFLILNFLGDEFYWLAKYGNANQINEVWILYTLILVFWGEM